MFWIPRATKKKKIRKTKENNKRKRKANKRSLCWLIMCQGTSSAFRLHKTALAFIFYLCEKVARAKSLARHFLGLCFALTCIWLSKFSKSGWFWIPSFKKKNVSQFFLPGFQWCIVGLICNLCPRWLWVFHLPCNIFDEYLPLFHLECFLRDETKSKVLHNFLRWVSDRLEQRNTILWE